MAIARTDIESKECFLIKQFRKKKWSLHEATPRKGQNVFAKLNIKSTKQLEWWFLNDEVICF